MKREIQTKGCPPNHKVGKECNPNDGSNERTSKELSFFLQEKERENIHTEKERENIHTEREKNKYSERERERRLKGEGEKGWSFLVVSRKEEVRKK